MAGSQTTAKTAKKGGLTGAQWNAKRTAAAKRGQR